MDFNQGHIDVLKEKVLGAIKDSGISLMKKVCGRHQINSHNVFEELPYTAVVPSDMGLPIIVDSQITYLVSFQGEFNLECSLTSPSAQLELSKKMSYTYNGYAGSFCPFTQEMLANNVANTNIEYGGVQPSVSNVVFVHGSFDPWHVLGVLEDLNEFSPAIVIPGTSHCDDMRPESPRDSEELTAARLRIGELVNSWICQEISSVCR